MLVFQRREHQQQRQSQLQTQGVQDPSGQTQAREARDWMCVGFGGMDRINLVDAPEEVITAFRETLHGAGKLTFCGSSSRLYLIHHGVQYSYSSTDFKPPS